MKLNIDIDSRELFQVLRTIADEIRNLEKSIDGLTVGDRIDDRLRPIYVHRMITLDRFHRKLMVAMEV